MMQRPILFEDFTEEENAAIDAAKVVKRRVTQPAYKGEKKGSNELKKLRAELMKDAPFIAWDGEGTSNPGNPQPYCLFGASTKDRLRAPQLSTQEMLQLILRVGRDNPYAIHVSYAFVYDVNQILWEFNVRTWGRLFEKYKLTGGKVVKKGEVYWKGYRIKWVPGKIFEVAGIEEGSGKYVKVTIYDIFSFFGCRFTEALAKWVPEYTRSDIIESGKANRNRFEWKDIKMITEYWTEEIEQLVVLADALRDNLRKGAGINIKKWYGPGAVAEELFTHKQHPIEPHMDKKIRSEVNRAAQYAYFAGRFELWQAGYFGDLVWQYDLNSAYPAAMAELPSLSEGYWMHVTDVTSIDHFGVYHIRRKTQTNTGADTRRMIRERNKTQKPQPLPYRTSAGAVRFPEWVEGWYWSPEARLVHGSDEYEFLEGWVFVESDPECRPFYWVADMYQRRLDFKHANNPAELSVKLGLNSLYGKMAQRIGWNEDLFTAPKWHQLEWAGFLTSYTRAMLYPVLLQAWEKNALVSCETDSVMATCELDINIDADKLGSWDVKKHGGVLYIQNGLYFLNKSGEWAHKIRGMDKPPGEGVELEPDQVPLTFQRAVQWLQGDDCFRHDLMVTTTRFVGIHKALHLRRPWEHRVWKTDEKHIKLGGNGKRVHIPAKCRKCQSGRTDGMVFHDLSLSPIGLIGTGGRVMSQPHKLPWLDDVDEHAWADEKARESTYGGEMIMDT